jgi:hypothetical protein
LEDQGFWVVAPYGWVVCCPGFEKPYRLYSPGYETIYGLIAMKMKAVRFCEPSGISYPTIWRNNPKCLFLQYEHMFATKEIFKRWVISSGKAATSPLH